MTEQCATPNCVRILGHSGCHTAAPSARTLDWDVDQAEQRHATKALEFLDFPTPWYHFLRDDLND